MQIQNNKSSLITRFAALFLVPCLIAETLVPAGAAPFGQQSAALIADAANSPIFVREALADPATQVLESISQHPSAEAAVDRQAAAPLSEEPRKWTNPFVWVSQEDWEIVKPYLGQGVLQSDVLFLRSIGGVASQVDVVLKVLAYRDTHDALKTIYRILDLLPKRLDYDATDFIGDFLVAEPILDELARLLEITLTTLDKTNNLRAVKHVYLAHTPGSTEEQTNALFREWREAGLIYLNEGVFRATVKARFLILLLKAKRRAMNRPWQSPAPKKPMNALAAGIDRSEEEIIHDNLLKLANEHAWSVNALTRALKEIFPLDASLVTLYSYLSPIKRGDLSKTDVVLLKNLLEKENAAIVIQKIIDKHRDEAAKSRKKARQRNADIYAKIAPTDVNDVYDKRGGKGTVTDLIVAVTQRIRKDPNDLPVLQTAFDETGLKEEYKVVTLSATKEIQPVELTATLDPKLGYAVARRNADDVKRDRIKRNLTHLANLPDGDLVIIIGIPTAVSKTELEAYVRQDRVAVVNGAWVWLVAGGTDRDTSGPQSSPIQKQDIPIELLNKYSDNTALLSGSVKDLHLLFGKGAEPIMAAWTELVREEREILNGTPRRLADRTIRFLDAIETILNHANPTWPLINQVVEQLLQPMNALLFVLQFRWPKEEWERLAARYTQDIQRTLGIRRGIKAQSVGAKAAYAAGGREYHRSRLRTAAERAGMFGADFSERAHFPGFNVVIGTPRIKIFAIGKDPVRQELAERLQSITQQMNDPALNQILANPVLAKKYFGSDLLADFAYFEEEGWTSNGRAEDTQTALKRYAEAVRDIEAGLIPSLSIEDLLRFRTFFLGAFGRRQWFSKGIRREDPIFPDLAPDDEVVTFQKTAWSLNQLEMDPNKRKIFVALYLGIRPYLVYKDLANAGSKAWYRAEGIFKDSSGHLAILQPYSPTAVRLPLFIENDLEYAFSRNPGDQQTESQLEARLESTGFWVRPDLDYLHARLPSSFKSPDQKWELLGPADSNRYRNVPLKTKEFPTIEQITQRVKADRRSRTFEEIFTIEGARAAAARSATPNSMQESKTKRAA